MNTKLKLQQTKTIKQNTENSSPPVEPKKRLSIFIEEQVQGFLRKNLRVSKKSFKEKYYSEMKDISTFQDAEQQMKSLSIISNQTTMRFINFLRKSFREQTQLNNLHLGNDTFETSESYDNLKESVARRFARASTEEFKNAIKNYNNKEPGKDKKTNQTKKNNFDYSEEEKLLFQKFGVDLDSKYLLANGEVHRKYHNLSEQYLKNMKTQCMNKYNEMKKNQLQSLRVKTENSESEKHLIYSKSSYLRSPRDFSQNRAQTQSLISTDQQFQIEKKMNRYFLYQKFIEQKRIDEQQSRKKERRETDYLKAQTSLNDIIQSVALAKQDFEVNIKSDYVKMIEMQQSLRLMKKKCKINEVFNDHETITNKKLQHKRIIKVLKKL